jgi:threonine dehydrogenase-like Zn-dependent dehydrogenase
LSGRWCLQSRWPRDGRVRQTVGGIGWIFGHLIDGTQAETVRVPYADTSLYAVPDSVTNEQAIFLADSLPTGYEVGVLAGQVRPGDTVAVVGAGAVGLSAILTTGLWGASKVIAIDTNKFRLEKALEFGATDVVEVGPGTVAEVIALTDGFGVDVSIDAVVYPETLLTAASLVRPGGSIANIGVHGTPVELPMQDMWIQNVRLTIATGPAGPHRPGGRGPRLLRRGGPDASVSPFTLKKSSNTSSAQAVASAEEAGWPRKQAVIRSASTSCRRERCQDARTSARTPPAGGMQCPEARNDRRAASMSTALAMPRC